MRGGAGAGGRRLCAQCYCTSQEKSRAGGGDVQQSRASSGIGGLSYRSYELLYPEMLFCDS